MLHAINHKKTRIHRRYLGHRDKNDRNVQEEDELTGLLLGPLAMLPDSSSSLFWYHLLYAPKVANLPSGNPESCRMVFWPKCKCTDGRLIEPDLVVELLWPNGEVRRVAVEMKWNAPLSGKDQLERQLRSTWEGNRFDYLVFIGKETTEALGVMASTIYKGRVAAWPWERVVTLLHHTCMPGLEDWSLQVSSFLEFVGIRGFRGFNNLPDFENRFLNKERIFWYDDMP